MALTKKTAASPLPLNKVPTGIDGFDEISQGGLPRNRPTIVYGGPGCGKTMMAMEFLINGAVLFDEPGVFMSFEDTIEELMKNLEYLPFDIAGLIKKKKLYIEHLAVDRAQNNEAGNFDLEGMFVRLEHAVKNLDAKRVVIDSLDALFFGLEARLLRHEIKRLFDWLKEKKITAIITSQINTELVSKDGIQLYLADCVVELDNRIRNQIAIRRLRIKKMRGSSHGNNEYPFLIDDSGLSVLPLISLLNKHQLSSKRITSGIADVDGMLDGKGYMEGSSILVSGSAGTGKTSIAISLIDAGCKRKARCLYCAFEESESQIARNMLSIGFNLEANIKSGVLQFYCSRPTLQNLELHLISIKKIIREFQPEIIVLDPVTNLMSEGINSEIRQMLANFVDYLKGLNITTLFTAAITLETIKSNPSDEGISAMMDTWILVRDMESNSERNRGINILKSRGMNHSTQIREFVITDRGIHLLPIYLSPEGVLSGSAKLEHTLKEEEHDKLYDLKALNHKNEIERRRMIMEEAVAFIKSKYKSDVDALNMLGAENDLRKETIKKSKTEITELRNKSKSSLQKSKSRNK